MSTSSNLHEEEIPSPRDEHLKLCKKEALAVLDRGKLDTAIICFLDNWAKGSQIDPQFQKPPILFDLVLMYIKNNDSAGVRRWIIGFN